jgi:hypothetical protein
MGLKLKRMFIQEATREKRCVRVGLNPEIGLARPRSFLITTVSPPTLFRFAQFQFKHCKNKHGIFLLAHAQKYKTNIASSCS